MWTHVEPWAIDQVNQESHDYLYSLHDRYIYNPK